MENNYKNSLQKFIFKDNFSTGLFLLIILPLLIKNPYIQHILTILFLWVVVASSWNLLLGYGGILSLGQFAFFGTGAYTSAWLVLNSGLNPFIACVIGGVFAIIVSLIVGVPCLRLKGMYIALITIAFQEMLRTLVIQRDFEKWTGGREGLFPVPPLQIGDFVFTTFGNLPYYYFFLSFMLVTIIIFYKIINSKIGLAIQAMRDSEIYAICLGINPFKYKLLQFVISAFFTGLTGGFYAHYCGVVDSTSLSILPMIFILTMIVVGGLGTLPGPIIGVFIVTAISELLREIELWRPIILGSLLIIMLIFAPEGIIKIITTRLYRYIKSKNKKISKNKRKVIQLRMSCDSW